MRAQIVRFAGIGCLMSIVPFQSVMHAQSDDFNDGNDDGWEIFDPLGDLGVAPPVEITFPEGGYRMVAPPPAIPDAGPARVFSFRNDQSYTDFYAAVDVVDWDDEINQAFGIIARADKIGLGQTTGYVCNYDPNQRSSRPGGQFQINRVTNEAEDGTIAVAELKLIPDHSYRIIFTGVGSLLTARIYDLQDLTRPLATIQADGNNDERAATYPGGVVGLFNFYRGTATDEIGRPDVTWDNYMARETAPEEPPFPEGRRGVEGAPQVTAKVPGSQASYHDPVDGLRFTTTTFGNGEVTGVTLTLNGRDVSSDLKEEAGEWVYGGDLQPNQIYKAEIRMTTDGGLERTHRYGFDTFDPESFNPDTVTVIEMEDYNYEGGKFQDNPPPSGFDEFDQQVNGDGVGYLDLMGTPGIDFHDTDENPPGGQTSYRIEDRVATRAGSDDVQPLIEERLVNDVMRPKYVEAMVPEYQVFMTEAGEWMNYTRTFPAGDYEVYLRVASREAQTVSLGQVADATVESQTVEPLGQFRVPNTVSPQWFQMVPLTGEDGRPAVVSLDGVSTVRLTVEELDDPFPIIETLYLNYLVFLPARATAPAAITLESSGSVASGYQAVADAVIDPEAGTITVPLPNGSQYYRLRGEAVGSLKISRFGLQGESLSFGFETQ